MIVAGSALAGTSVIANGAAEVFAGAGWSDASVDTIRFTVPGGNVGDGSAITGFENGTRTDTLIDASARAPVNNSRTAVWTVDSSVPLSCITPATCGSTTIPLTRFRWTVAGGTETCNDLVAFGRQTLDATFGDLCPADPDNPPELPECALFGANIAECFVARCPATEPTEDILARAYASFCNQAVAGGTLNPADAGALGAVGCDHPVISEIVAEQVAEQGAFCEEGPSTDPELCATACMEVGPCIPADGEGAALRDPDLCIQFCATNPTFGPEAWACVAEGGQCQEIIACLQNQPPPVADVPECGPFASKVFDCIEVSCPTASALEAGLTDLGRSICNQAVAEAGGNVESLMGIADAACDDPRIAPYVAYFTVNTPESADDGSLVTYCAEGALNAAATCEAACERLAPCLPAEADAAILRDVDVCAWYCATSAEVPNAAWLCMAEAPVECAEVLACVQN